jgi:hypothetical protein
MLITNRPRLAAPATVLACVLLAGCGEEEAGSPSAASVDRPAPPPRGWRTVSNERAAFSIAIPGSWQAQSTARRTLIRSPDRSAAVTVVADRSPSGQELEPDQYVRRTLAQLPEYEGSSSTPKPVRGSPYRSTVVTGRGRVSTSRSLQRITVAAFHLPRRATYTLIGFGNARATDRVVERMLPTLRGG